MTFEHGRCVPTAWLQFPIQPSSSNESHTCAQDGTPHHVDAPPFDAPSEPDSGHRVLPRDSEHGNQDRTGIPTDVLRAHRTADKSRYPGVQGLGEHNPIAGPYRATRTMLDIAIVDIVLSERRPRKYGKSRRSRGSPRSSSWCRPPARSLKDLPQRNTEIPFHHLYAIASQRPQIQSSSEIYDAYHHFRFVRGRQFRSLNQSVFEVLTPPTVRWVQASVPR